MNALAVLGLIVVGTVVLFDDSLGMSAPERWAQTIHVWIGYVLIVNLLWRFVWAFFGNTFWLEGHSARRSGIRRCSASLCFRHSLPVSPNAISVTIQSVELPVLVILVLLVIQAATGLVLAGTDIFYPPFGNWVARWVAAPNTDPSALTPLAQGSYQQRLRGHAVVPGAVRGDPRIRFLFAYRSGCPARRCGGSNKIREGGALVSAMFTGRKIIPGRPEDLEPNMS